LLVATSEGRGGEHVGAILQARAALEGVLAPAPDGWLDPRTSERERALIGALPAPPAEVRRAWTRVLALSDPDPGVRSLAELLLLRPDPDDVDGIAWSLLPEGARARPSGHGLHELFVAGGDEH